MEPTWPGKFVRWYNPTERGGLETSKGERWFNPTALLWGGTIPPHLRPSKDGVLPNEVGKDEEGTLP